jgi:hypothetical protein
MNRIRGGTALIVACLLVAPGALQAQEQQFPPPESEIEPLSINCMGGTYTTGSGASLFSLCVSDNGNMVSLAYPAGFEHINIGSDDNQIAEGYSVCVTNPFGNYWDFGFGGIGFGAPEVLDAAPFPITIRRSSNDGRITLDQKFVPNKVGRTMTITMTVTNNTTTTLTGVKVARVVDPDMDGTIDDDVFDHSTDQAWARQGGLDPTIPRRSLVLAAPTTSVPHNTALTQGEGAPGCSIASGPPAAGDYGMRIVYDVGSIAPGKKKVVVFRYNGA